MNRLLIVTSLMLALVTGATSAHAAIIRVEKDGSGDYVTLQEGLDAAQPGDTVRIGPGRYDTFSVRTFATGGTLQVVGYLNTPNVTIEGTDRDAVRIGPGSLTASIDGLSTTGFGIDQSGVGVGVRNLTIENLLAGTGSVADNTTFESLTVLSSGQTGLQLSATDGAVIRNCFFSGNAKQAVWLVAQVPSQNVLVENCIVESSNTAFDIGTAKNVIVRNCDFRANAVAMQYWNGATGQIEDCTFEDSSVLHLFVGNQSDVALNNCTFGPGARSSLEIDSGNVRGTGNVFGGGWQDTIDISGGVGSASFSNCTILNGGQYSVFGNAGGKTGQTFQDFRNNYWGTSDPAQIAEWIFDVNDFPQFPEAIPVAFEPFLEQSVATETTTMGSIKALFADPK
jgi:Right handed beta helix region